MTIIEGTMPLVGDFESLSHYPFCFMPEVEDVIPQVSSPASIHAVATMISHHY